jgi:hypothetical protein
MSNDWNGDTLQGTMRQVFQIRYCNAITIIIIIVLI